MADDRADSPNDAPGGPGISPTWSSSAKDMVTTALGASRVWATIGYGIVNEVYWPSTGQPQIRDFGFIIKGPKGWTEVKRAQRYMLTTPKPYIPIAKVVHEGEDYRLELEFLPHPLRDGLLIRYSLEGDDLSLYALLAPHLGGDRRDNFAWAGDDLSAQKGEVALCLRADCGFSKTSAGYVGTSDGWQDFTHNGEMAWSYERAMGGNVALMGALGSNAGCMILTFAQTLEGARTLARSGLADDYDAIKLMFSDAWEDWGKSLVIPYTSPELRREAELSAAVLKIHEDRTYAGALVASLSVPWGSSHDDLGGYHLVWTRDAVEAALALVAVAKTEEASRILAYLVGTQAADGSWAQNYFPDGRGYWSGNQLDEVALPVLLAAKMKAVGALAIAKPVEEMMHRALGFIARNGPMSDQDRWEENAGASPFTLAVTISAIVAGADFFPEAERAYLLSLADCWNERIEPLTFVEDGPLAKDAGAAGYYVRLAPRAIDGGLRGCVDVRNRADGETDADMLVGLEFLYLVRTGLRRFDDPRIISSLKVIDKILRVETPSGPSYHRYNGDGYGEHEDGSPFDGVGVGRLWPLLTGERGHYALAAGEDVQPYLDAMARMTGPGGLIPEQIWDSEAIEERGLFPGKPSGSAMPLVWAHAEFLKLLAAQANGRPAELLDVVQIRWNGAPPSAPVWHWRANSPFRQMPAGRDLMIEAQAPFALALGESDAREEAARKSGLPVLRSAADQKDSTPTYFGMHSVTLTADALKGRGSIDFSLQPQSGDADAINGHIDFIA